MPTGSRASQAASSVGRQLGTGTAPCARMGVRLLAANGKRQAAAAAAAAAAPAAPVARVVLRDPAGGARAWNGGPDSLPRFFWLDILQEKREYQRRLLVSERPCAHRSCDVCSNGLGCERQTTARGFTDAPGFGAFAVTSPAAEWGTETESRSAVNKCPSPRAACAPSCKRERSTRDECGRLRPQRRPINRD